MSEIQVLLLAGGKGKRMWPLSACKSLISFGGKPIIRWIFDDLKAAGIKDFKIVCNPEHLQGIKKEFARETVKVKYYLQKKPLGMADSVMSVPDLGSQPMIVVSPEDLVEPELYAGFVKKCQTEQDSLISAGLHRKNYFSGGYFILKDGKLKGLVEKPGKGNNPSDYVKLVLDYFPDATRFVSYLKKNSSQKDDVYEAAFDKMIKDNLKSQIYKYDGYWQSLKYPWHVLEMMELIFKNRITRRIANNCQIHKSAVINGEVVIEPGVRVFENAVIKGPSYIGKNAVIGTNALVREANISENCVVGFNSEIARSWIGPDCWFHSNYIGDSILEEDISFGAGALTANFRLDKKEIEVHRTGKKQSTGRTKFGAVIGKGVRVGVNTSLMPGLLLGAGCFVGPGLVLYDNLKEKQSSFLDKKSVIIK